MHSERDIPSATGSQTASGSGHKLRAGRIIANKFRLTHQLGQGGMGAVWAAVHQTLGREVAVKFLQPQSGQSAVLADRFVSEAHMVASIKHRFVVDVFDFGVTEDGLHYMVLELLSGRSLADRMDDGPPLSVKKGVRLMADCLRGLHVVHEAGIIHRDLKPDNIFVMEDADGAYPKLIDFGISRRTNPPNLKLDAAASRKSRLTQPGTVLGTPFYMSPEQLRGKQNVDRRSDIYSVGVILYELLVGRLPFRQDNIGDLMVAITLKGAPSLLEARPELGEALAAIVKRALAPAADERYSTALELREALLAALPRLPDDAACVVQLPSADGEFSLSGDTSLQLQAAKSPFAESLSAPALRRSVLARVPKVVWAAGALVLLAGLGFALIGGEDVAEDGADPQLTAAVPEGAAAPGPLGPRTPAVPAKAAAEAQAPQSKPGATPSASAADAPHPASPAPADRPSKAARSRRSPRATGADRPQKLYKKLDF